MRKGTVLRWVSCFSGAYFMCSIRRLLVKFLLLCLLVPLSGCELVTTWVFTAYLEPDPPKTPSAVVAQRDQIYATRDGHDLLLDLYMPAQRTEEALPVVLFLFGGGWQSGNRHQFIRFGLLEYPEEGFAVITADYRYLTEAVYPAQIEDVKSVLRWIRVNADTFGLDAQRIGVIGPSAGGHLAALAGTSNQPGELEVGEPSDIPTHVHAVVDYYGPTDFLQGDAHRTEDADPWNAPDSSVSRLIGAPIESVPDKVAMANPISFIDGTEPPFLIIHGEKDGLVPLHQSEILHEALVAAGVSSELMVVEDGDHGYGGDFFEDEHGARVRKFFHRHLRPEARN